MENEYQVLTGEAIVVYAKNIEGGLMYFGIFKYPEQQADAHEKFKKLYTDSKCSDARMMTIQRFEELLL